MVQAQARGRNFADRLDRFAAGVFTAVVALAGKLATRMERDREVIAASWRRAAQVLAAGIARVRHAAASGTRFAQAGLEGAARHTHAASMRASRSVRMSAYRLGVAARTRTITTAADLRSRARTVARIALARSATGWSGASLRARQIGASVSSARAVSGRRIHRGLAGAAPLLHRGRARLALPPVRSALSMAGSLAALAIVIARASIPTLGGAPLGERIHFRVNSHPWSTVELDGVEAGATPFTIALAPGPHHFRVEMADGRVLEEVLVVSTERDRVGFR